MKSLLVLVVMLFSLQSWAVREGLYECESLYEGDGIEEYIGFEFELGSDHLTLFGMMDDGSDEIYYLGQKNDGWIDLDLGLEETALDYLRYRLYRDKGDVLKLVSVMKYKSVEPLSESTLTFKPAGRSKVKIVSLFTNEITEEVEEYNCIRVPSF